MKRLCLWLVVVGIGFAARLPQARGQDREDRRDYLESAWGELKSGPLQEAQKIGAGKPGEEDIAAISKKLKEKGLDMTRSKPERVLAAMYEMGHVPTESELLGWNVGRLWMGDYPEDWHRKYSAEVSSLLVAVKSPETGELKVTFLHSYPFEASYFDYFDQDKTASVLGQMDDNSGWHGGAAAQIEDSQIRWKSTARYIYGGDYSLRKLGPYLILVWRSKLESGNTEVEATNYAYYYGKATPSAQEIAAAQQRLKEPAVVKDVSVLKWGALLEVAGDRWKSPDGARKGCEEAKLKYRNRYQRFECIVNQSIYSEWDYSFWWGDNLRVRQRTNYYYELYGRGFLGGSEPPAPEHSNRVLRTRADRGRD